MPWKRYFRKSQLALHVITMNRRESLSHLITECSEFFDVIRVCDGGSTDGTPQMVKALGAEYHYRRWDDQYHEQDNVLLACARPGDWVMILDDDECPSRSLLDNMRDLIARAKKERCNMISMPCILVLDDVLECEESDFITEVQAGIRKPFRKFWLFAYDPSVKSYGSPHRRVESLKGWRVFDQPYPYYHYKTSLSFIINDCIHAWIYPAGQQYTVAEAKAMYAALPEFKTSREIEPWLRSADVDDTFVAFAHKFKDSDKPIRNWWAAYERIGCAAQ